MKALVIGGTGLVGGHIIHRLIELPEITEVISFSRRNSGLVHPKLREEIVDFNHVESWKDKLKGDILYSAMGTTIKVAGSKEAQFKIDHDYQLHTAEAAAHNGVRTYVLISSTGAKASSPFFYLRMKGQLEEKIKKLSFQSITILRPSLLRGHRERPRAGEIISDKVLSVLPSFLVPDTMKPVDGSQVAKVAVNAGIEGRAGVQILEASDIHPK